jgi:hypothetical protein
LSKKQQKLILSAVPRRFPGYIFCIVILFAVPPGTYLYTYGNDHLQHTILVTDNSLSIFSMSLKQISNDSLHRNVSDRLPEEERLDVPGRDGVEAGQEQEEAAESHFGGGGGGSGWVGPCDG